MSRIVVKFGGTSVQNGERVKRAAESVAREVKEGNEVCVVVSAMGQTTDELLHNIEKVGGAGGEDENEIVSMGERTSVRLFKTALENEGVESFFLEPGDELWPIITDEEGDLDTEETTRRVDSLANALGDKVPVVCGFLGENREGRITTLGRGGSDTTAMVIGSYMSADEVIIVTDVDGIMSGDPENVDEPRSIDEITVNEMQDLSVRGAKVIAPAALNYKRGDMVVKIVHHKHGDLRADGTVIEGERDYTHYVELREDPIAAVTVAGRSVLETPNLLSKLSTALGEGGINIYGVATAMDSVSFFVDQADGGEAESLLHDAIVDHGKFSSVSLRDDIAMIMVSGGEFIGTPGVVHEMTGPLAEEEINIIEILSSTTSIVLFVEWDVRQRAFELIDDIYGDI